MDDQEYARQLFAILTRPLDPDEPVDAHGTRADGIDRCDGFGTDVRVTALEAVPGQHGNQIDIAFELDLPDHLSQVPETGSLLLPVDAEWR
ncbi:MAG TPA: hypothetical protein VGV65_04190, partial [Nocardioides sp.]|nr:hypothetical protein [Nocardioides sp.]